MSEGNKGFSFLGKGWVEWLNTLGPIIGLVLVFALFAALAPKSFATARNFETIARQTAIVGIAALGMTLVIICGGIDLSVGSVIALATVVVAIVLRLPDGSEFWSSVQNSMGWAFPLAAACCGVLAAAACGAFTGLTITVLRMVPFIVTLGMLLVMRGLAKGIAGEQKIDAPLTWLNDLLAALGPDDRWMIVPAGVWFMLALALMVWVLLRFTRFGRHVLAIGSNEMTARLCGVPVGLVKFTVYTLCAGFAGLAGVMQFSRLTVGDPTVAIGLELDVIAAVVIGGGSLSGGEGSVLGTIVGALIMTVINSGCAQMGLPNWVQEIVTGGVIVVAVALDRLRHRRE